MILSYTAKEAKEIVDALVEDPSFCQSLESFARGECLYKDLGGIIAGHIESAHEAMQSSPCAEAGEYYSQLQREEESA